jgi:hypothetical protein
MKPEFLTRRDFMRDPVLGIGGVALAGLLCRDRLLASGSGAGNGTHFPAKARRVVQVFLGGGLSHVDSFDFKPELVKHHGGDLPGSLKADAFFGKVGRLHRPHYEFRPRGRSGLMISDLFPGLAELADDLTLVRSMKAETANHIPGIFQANTGFRQMGFPSMGSWLSYGLGSENEDLPAFVVLPDARGIPNAAGGSFNWSAGFLPARHQGMAFQAGGRDPVANLFPEKPVGPELAADRAALLKRLGQWHREGMEEAAADPLVARIQSYELAARMQAAIPEAMDFTKEPAFIRERYGLDREECRDTARNCLAARRLLERGVRMVQLWTGDGVSWDAHENITGSGYKSHTGEARRIDRPVAGLILDLKERGLLDSTLVLITTEFGRTPYAQSGAGTLSKGRDHHPEAFTNVLCGAGLKPGHAHGATDEIGYHAVDGVVTTPDFHATILHLLGLDHERLTFYHNGIQRRLTNVHGHVVEGILA